MIAIQGFHSLCEVLEMNSIFFITLQEYKCFGVDQYQWLVSLYLIALFVISTSNIMLGLSSSLKINLEFVAKVLISSDGDHRDGEAFTTTCIFYAINISCLPMEKVNISFKAFSIKFYT